MSLSLYQASVPAFLQMLNNLSTFLDKAQAHADAKKFDSANYLGLRLAPDMLPFSKQVQIACDASKLCVARISGVEAPKFDDKEATLAELQERIAKTVDYLKSVPADSIDGQEAKAISFKAGPRELNFTGQGYVLHFAKPNMYFHVTTTYALLRQAGVELGKMDYLAGAQ